VAATLRLISWPFDLGIADVGVGAGGRDLARDEPLRALLADQGWDVALDVVPGVDERRPETAGVFELDRRLAHRVRAAVEEGAFPLVLGGNCNSCLGTVSGLRPGPIGVVWFDAHADFDTTDDNLSGYFDVMALTILTGSAWRTLRETIPGFAPVDERDVVLAAVRDLEPYQRDVLERSAVRTVPGAMDAGELESALDDLRERVDRVYLHLDLDALDADEAPANQYAAVGGPSLDTVLGAVDAVFERFTVAAAALTAYDPSFDADGRAKAAARRLLARVGQLAQASRSGSGSIG
jgi:arginase